MRLRLALLLVAAVALEAGAILVLAAGHPPPALALHLASSLLAGAWIAERLLRARTSMAVALSAGWAFFVPVLGLVGSTAVAVAVTPRAARDDEERSPWVQTPIPGRACIRARTSPAAVRSASRRPDEREALVAAMSGSRREKDPAAVERLWNALKDPEEEIRLLAFSLLEAKSSTAYRNIHALGKELETAEGARRGAIHARLAFEHWELVWLGLVQGELLAHELARATQHARAGLEHEPGSAPLHFLLGRILLRRGQLDEARPALRRAQELGMASASVQPYLAEVAFRNRSFDDVRGHLARIVPRGNTPAARVQRYWA